MLKKLTVVAVVGVAALMVGCSTTSTNLYPKGNHKYVAVSQSRSQSDAANAAVKKADLTCKSLNEKLVVTSNESSYQGSGKQLGALTEAASDVAATAGGIFFNSSKTNADYKSTVTFVCR